MANNVRFTSAFDDRISSPLDRIRDKFDQLGKSKGAQSILGGVGLGVGVAAFGLLERAIGGTVDMVGDFVRKAQEEEVGIQRLGASLKANVSNWDGNTDAIERTILKREDLAFQDDKLRDSLALLVGATHDVNKALDIQSTAMDLARFKGISLQEASEALTKVEAGSYRILKSLGIVLRDGATQTEALAAVQRVAGGQAEAYAKTTAGAFDLVQIKLEDAEEEIGKQLLPVLADLARTFVKDIIPAAQDFVGSVQDVLSPVAKLNDLLKDQGGIIGVVGDAWETATGPLKDAGDAFFEIGYQIDEVNGKTHSAEDTFRHAALSMGISVDDLKAKVVAAQGAQVAWAHESERGAAAMSRAYTDALPEITAAATDDARVLANQIAGQEKAVRQEAYDLALAAAGGLISGQSDVESGAAALVEALKHQISGAKRIALLEGQLTGDEMTRGLKSKDPLVRARALKWKADIEEQLDALRKDAATSGAAIGTAWISGIGKGINSHYSLLTHELNRVAGDMKGKSPPKTGPLKDLDKGAANIARSWTGAFARQLDAGIGGMRGALSGLAIGGLPAMAGAAGGRGGMAPVSIPVILDGQRVGMIADRRLYYDLSRSSPSATRK